MKILMVFIKFPFVLSGIIFMCLIPFSTFSADDKGLIGISLPASFQAFSDDSPWNTPVPESPEIDVDSDKMVKHLKDKSGIIKGDTVKWSIPLFVIDSTVCPRISIKSTKGELYSTIDPDNNGTAENIPMPQGVWPDPEEDAHMVLVDPEVNKVWEFSQAKQLSDGSWTASIIDVWDLKGLGYRKPFYGSRWWRSGAMGGGMPLIAGLIRPEEIEAGVIRHALLCATPINRKATQDGGSSELCSPPASRTDGYGYGVEYIPEGARIQLDPTLDLDSLGLSEGSKTVAKAMQQYGMIVGINSGTFKVFFQNLGTDAKAWEKYDHFHDLQNIPVENFRILKCNIVTKKTANSETLGSWPGGQVYIEVTE